ncbi:hypothetical protein, partial [Streptomyces sp. NPDC051572]|uniref:hypothetical protein n=1 Tax=Streptomyces sp. NPDC051572 TaxID=3155802 RepID=UPI003450ED75
RRAGDGRTNESEHPSPPADQLISGSRMTGEPHTVTTRIPRSLADQLHFHAGKLDGVGPGHYADGGQLAQINEQMSGIELWP